MPLTASTPAPISRPRADDCPTGRLRVLHLVFSLETGGLENGVVNLCNRLDPERFETSICTFVPGGALGSRVDSARVSLDCVRRFWNNDPTLPVRLARRLRQRPVDVLHTHSWGTLVEGVLAAKLAKVPVVVHGEHGVLNTQRRHVVLQRWLWSRVDQLLAVASPLADQMSRLVSCSRDRIKVLVNGVDTARFRPRREDEAGLRTSFGLPEGPIVVGMVARLVPVKNHAGVLRAVALLRSKGLDVVLALAGDGPLRNELTLLARELQIEDAVCFVGNVENVARFYRALDVFVLNSDSEGMSNTILEAMASGLPVVATNVGAAPEMITPGSTGTLVPPGDDVALADAIQSLIRQSALRARYAAAARDRAVETYSMDRMIERYEMLYSRLAANFPARKDG